MKITNLFPGSFQSNCWLITDGPHAVVIDPSANHKTIISAAQTEGATLEGILLTHGHFDHIGAVDSLRKALPIKVYAHENDADNLSDGDKNAYAFFFGRDMAYKNADAKVKDGDVLEFGTIRLKALHTPGHTAGSVCYRLLGTDALFTGDTIFASNCGRCDLYSGDWRTLKQSFKLLERYSDENPDITIYPGHDEESSLERALILNKYL